MFPEFSRHLDQNYEKRTKLFGLKEKIIKISQVGIKVNKIRGEKKVPKANPQYTMALFHPFSQQDRPQSSESVT